MTAYSSPGTYDGWLLQCGTTRRLLMTQTQVLRAKGKVHLNLGETQASGEAEFAVMMRATLAQICALRLRACGLHELVGSAKALRIGSERCGCETASAA